MRTPRRAAVATVSLLAGSAMAIGMATSAAGTPAATRHRSAVSMVPAKAHHVRVPKAGRAVNTSHPDHVVGHGTPKSCSSSAFVKAVAAGGVITFNCGPKHVRITLKKAAHVTDTSKRVVIDGGGKVTLSGDHKHRILFMNTCGPSHVQSDNCYAVAYPRLVVQNITMRAGNSQSTAGIATYPPGGGAIFELGGRFKVVNSTFINNRCYHVGPDLGGGAIRAIMQEHQPPVYITNDTFRGGRCSNGSALSSISTSWVVTNSTFTDNKAIGHGQNPAEPGTPGGGSGGAIYMDGDAIALSVAGSTFENNVANEGAGAIFFVSDNRTGTLTISDSTLHNNPSGTFSTPGYPGIYYHSSGKPTVTNSTID